MALQIRVLGLLILCLISFLVLSHQCNSQKSDATEEPTFQNLQWKKCKIDKLYQLGDSLSDTGNCMRESICGVRDECSKFPYGVNFSNNTITGRCSDGMLIIDFIALESDLPLLNPYKLQNGNFTNGANFAVAGATALPAEILAEKKIATGKTNSSLNVQLDRMSSYFKNTCYPDCPVFLKNSLFLVGEIGGNDFSFGLYQGKTIEELRNMVPEVVQTIINGVRTVIRFGATRIIVPGNFPIGCHPVLLTRFRTNSSTAYDDHHCLKELNNFAIFFNDHLKQAIRELKKGYQKVTLIYGDYYNAYLWLLDNAVKLGFDKNSLLKACCGIGGDYNYNTIKICGAPGVPLCVDPSTYISWDGLHLTQAAYKWLAKWLIHDMLPKLNCQSVEVLRVKYLKGHSTLRNV